MCQCINLWDVGHDDELETNEEYEARLKADFEEEDRLNAKVDWMSREEADGVERSCFPKPVPDGYEALGPDCALPFGWRDGMYY